MLFFPAHGGLGKVHVRLGAWYRFLRVLSLIRDKNNGAANQIKRFGRNLSRRSVSRGIHV